MSIMNNKWIEISYQWAARCKTYKSIDIDVYDYLDILGLYETCWFSYDFDEEDEKTFGYPNDK